MPGIFEVWQAVVGSWRGCIEFGRASHGERLMRAFAVELAHEGIERGLLLQSIEARRASSLLLQGQMHALMASILLRMAGLDALD